MVNRSIQAKLLKKKRRGRYARFSGGDSRIHAKYVEVLKHEGEDKVSVKTVKVYVGLVSLSNQVPKGKGPDAERMAQYYHAVNAKSFETRIIPEAFEIKDPRYAKIWNETPSHHRITLTSDENNRLDLFIHDKAWFFVDLDYKRKVIRRSRDYGSKEFAMSRLAARSITWVDSIPMSSAPK